MFTGDTTNEIEDDELEKLIQEELNNLNIDDLDTLDEIEIQENESEVREKFGNGKKYMEHYLRKCFPPRRKLFCLTASTSKSSKILSILFRKMSFLQI